MQYLPCLYTITRRAEKAVGNIIEQVSGLKLGNILKMGKTRSTLLPIIPASIRIRNFHLFETQSFEALGFFRRRCTVGIFASPGQNGNNET